MIYSSCFEDFYRGGGFERGEVPRVCVFVCITIKKSRQTP